MIPSCFYTSKLIKEAIFKFLFFSLTTLHRQQNRGYRITDVSAPDPTLQEILLSREQDTKGAFHLPELTGQTIPVVMGISLLIRTIQPDQSNPK